MRRGRKPTGPKLVEKLEGTEGARQRLRVILETVSAEKSVEQACQELGLSEAMFHKLRSRFFQEAVGLLEPRTPGRKKQQMEAPEEKVAELEDTVAELTEEVELSRLRTEIALIMPHLLTDEAKAEVKKTAQERKEKKKRNRRKLRRK